MAGNFLVALLVVAAVVDEDALFLVILGADDVATDAGLALGAWTEARWVGQHGFEEFDRLDLLALEIDWFDRRHADVFQHT